MFDVLIYKSIIFLGWSHKSQCLQNKAKKVLEFEYIYNLSNLIQK